MIFEVIQEEIQQLVKKKDVDNTRSTFAIKCP